MGFKPNPNKKVRLDELSKAALIKTVKALQRRETKLLNEVERLKHTAGEACDTCGAVTFRDCTAVDAGSGAEARTTFPWEK